VLAYFKVPAHWEFLREPFPRDVAGKVMKYILLGKANDPFIEE